VPLALKSFTALAFDGIKVTARREVVPDSEPTRVRAILLLSQDANWADNLDRANRGNGFAVLRTPSVSEASERMRMERPCAAMLDLDLPSDAGWRAAEWLLRDAVDVPSLLLTRRADHYELGAAIRFGSALDKSVEPARLFAALNSLLAQSDQERLARAASQQAWLRRARPYRWTEGPAQPYRNWGINE
jgi:DNA-binding response OmpR family regulator